MQFSDIQRRVRRKWEKELKRLTIGGMLKLPFTADLTHKWTEKEIALQAALLIMKTLKSRMKNWICPCHTASAFLTVFWINSQ